MSRYKLVAFFLSVVFLLPGFFWTTPAQCENGLYAVLGMSYSSEDFKTSGHLDGFDLQNTRSLKDTEGLWATIGFQNNPFFGYSLDFEHMFKYKTSGTANIQGQPLPFDGDFRLTNITLNLEASLPVWLVRPYARLGIGWMWAHSDVTYQNVPVGMVVDEFVRGGTSDWCTRTGVGLDINLPILFFIRGGVDYVLGRGDVSAVRYWDWRLGVGVRF